jgi:predicted PurR-regulated permease PerM
VLVLAIVLVIGVVALIVVQAISGSVRGFSDDLPQIVDRARHSDLGSFINSGSDSLETLRKHASDIANGVGRVSGASPTSEPRLSERSRSSSPLSS